MQRGKYQSRALEKFYCLDKRAKSHRLVSQLASNCVPRGGVTMPGTFEMSSERRRNEPVPQAAKIAEVSPRRRILCTARFSNSFRVHILLYIIGENAKRYVDHLKCVHVYFNTAFIYIQNDIREKKITRESAHARQLYFPEVIIRICRKYGGN